MSSSSVPPSSAFQPTPSLRRATTASRSPWPHRGDFNPRPPCGGRRIAGGFPLGPQRISTHALLAEGDVLAVLIRKAFDISTHALLAEGDYRAKRNKPNQLYFNPRPPCGGRLCWSHSSKCFRHISTHALLAEGDGEIGHNRQHSKISTHALLAEGDARSAASATSSSDFNPRPPCGGRLIMDTPISRGEHISTHALLAEGDSPGEPAPALLPHFNPRPPCGGRRVRLLPLNISLRFQPTPSLRRATPSIRR